MWGNGISGKQSYHSRDRATTEAQLIINQADALNLSVEVVIKNRDTGEMVPTPQSSWKDLT
jgi:hypothetical protein